MASDLSVCSSETQCCHPLEELLIVSFCPGFGQDVQTYISKIHEWCGPYLEKKFLVMLTSARVVYILVSRGCGHWSTRHRDNVMLTK